MSIRKGWRQRVTRDHLRAEVLSLAPLSETCLGGFVTVTELELRSLLSCLTEPDFGLTIPGLTPSGSSVFWNYLNLVSFFGTVKFPEKGPSSSVISGEILFSHLLNDAKEPLPKYCGFLITGWAWIGTLNVSIYFLAGLLTFPKVEMLMPLRERPEWPL